MDNVKAPSSIQRRNLLSALVLLPVTAWFGPKTGATVTLDQRRRHQVIEGFGTCINTWKAAPAAVYQDAGFPRTYLDMLGASALRIELWNGVALTPRERWQDISWKDFNFEGQGSRGLVSANVAQRLNAASNGRLRVIATTWSPPAWMKINNSLGNGHPQRKNFGLNLSDPVERGRWTQPQPGDEGGVRYQYVARNKLRPDRYQHFAKLLVEWVRYYRSLGINLYAISPTNEPVFSHWFESCVFTPDEYAELVETIARMFGNQGEPALPLFGPEHMTGDTAKNRLYLESLGQRPASLKAMAAIAAHGYVDGYVADRNSESTTALKNLVTPYGKRIWVTEGGFGMHDWPAPLHELGASFLYALRDGNVSLMTTWQTLDGFPATEHGLMSEKGPTKKTYAAMQFWRFIRPGMVRIGADVNGKLDAVAFEDPASHETVLILLNRNKTAVQVSLSRADNRAQAIKSAFVTDASRDFVQISDWKDAGNISMPPEAIATLQFAT